MALAAVHDNRRRRNGVLVQLRLQVTLAQLMFVLFVQMRQSLGGDLCRWQIERDLAFEQPNYSVKVGEGHVDLVQGGNHRDLPLTCQPHQGGHGQASTHGIKGRQRLVNEPKTGRRQQSPGQPYALTFTA
jgi:hypothetical protein